jgi:ankyrin repeat protein
MNQPGQFERFRSLALDENVVGMSAMLAAGFDVNTTNDSHESVFIHCCANNRLKAARFLAARGADINLSDHGGGTPMDFAVRYASRDFADWLARLGGRRHGSSGYAAASA